MGKAVSINWQKAEEKIASTHTVDIGMSRRYGTWTKSWLHHSPDVL